MPQLVIFQALDKCQLGDLVRAKEGRLESTGEYIKLVSETWSKMSMNLAIC